MVWQAWMTLLVLISVLAFAYKDHNRAWRYFIVGAVLLYLTGVNSVEDSFQGILNEGVLTLIVMLVISKSLFEAGLIDGLVKALLPSKWQGAVGFSLRVLMPVALISGVLNNTPVVALLIQPIRQWARKNNLEAHQFLLPLSYAAIVGGTLTLVGTSTNLVVLGLLQSHQVEHGLSLFSPAIVGFPILVVTIAYFVFLIRQLKLKSGSEPLPQHGNYLFRATLTNSDFVGKSLIDAGLRQLENGYLYQIQRKNGDVIDAASQTLILKGDELHFSGSPHLGNELAQLNMSINELPNQAELNFYEVIVPSSSGLAGKTPKEIDFRESYNASIVSVAHQDKSILGRIGEWNIQPGDMMVLCAGPHWSNSNAARDFQLLSQSQVKQTKAALVQACSIIGLLAAIFIGAFTSVGLLKATSIYLIMLLLLNITTPKNAVQQLPYDLLLVIIASLAIAKASVDSGLAMSAVEVLRPLINGPITSLVSIYIATWLLTELLTNNAAAAIMLPFALAIGDVSGLSVDQVALTVMIAASSSFISPFGYQTNLMVMAPGNYTPSDYFKSGLPLLCLTAAVTVSIVFLLGRF
ncbi:SLC13 family permease [Reinekea marinisedimentorum]|uniref:Di/tricarboxylate transporter n=1 Tax=Reinekea marinisedimentorum TaxID=230495 RepID=A0A4R3I9A6_9GAMM|nr:SLC13 family permease [Reinekea marinisedimentorum]TCS41962.1 di/tricarboxylate transporter [Reinekea marinisedimentorum]